MQRNFLLLSLAAALLAGCSTELEINDEYKDITVIYGLMNQRDSIHLVKINKAFLGEGDAYAMALVQDSSEYNDEAISLAVVELLDGNGNVVETYPLQDTLITTREPGTFYAPVQKLFYFTTPFYQVLPPGSTGVRMYLRQDDTYRLRVVVNGREITGTTAITNDFRIDPVDQSLDNSARVNLRNFNNTDYASYEFNWTSRADNKRFEVSYRFRYDEITGTDTVHKEIVQRLGTKVASAANEDLAVALSGESFFSGISSQIRSESGWNNVTRRIFLGMDFLVSVANADYHTYLTLNEPVTGVINDRPVYSNIDGAYGVWGSRYTKNVVGKGLNGFTLNELTDGQYTGDLDFCSALDAGSCN